MKLPAVLFILLFSFTTQSVEVVDSKRDALIEINEVRGTGIEGCTASQLSQNIKIRKECQLNWRKLGLAAPLTEAQLRGVKECADSYVVVKSIEGCAEALMALPIVLGETAALAAVWYATKPKPDSYIYVFQNGTLAEMKAFLSNEFFREMCELAPSDINTYPALACPNTQSHINHGITHGKCREQALVTVNKARVCHRSNRNAYKARVEDINKEAIEMLRVREKLKKDHSYRMAEINRIREACRVEMNPFGSFFQVSLSPAIVAARGAKALQNFVYPSDKEVLAFNRCVWKQTVKQEDLREELFHNSLGFIEQITGYIDSMQCFNARERMAMSCHTAQVIYSGGGAVMAKLTAKQIGKMATKKIYARLGKRIPESANVGANLKQIADALKQTGREVAPELTPDLNLQNIFYQPEPPEDGVNP